MKKIASIAVFMLTALMAQAQKVTFYSPEFEDGVRSHIGLGESDNVLQTQTDTITCLNLSGLGITDIRDVIYLTAVVELDLSYNRITDVSPLLPLESLRALNLSNNKLENINILAFMQAESLEVDISNNYISDFSYFYTPIPCDLHFLGMGMQMEKDAPYFEVYQLYADVNDEEQSVISYRGYTNKTATAYLKYGSSSVSAQLDGNTYMEVITEGMAETIQATLSNGEESETTYVVPSADYKVEAGKTITLTTGLPDDYYISSACAIVGTVEAIGNTLQYTASESASPDTISFSYYQGSTFKGYSRFFINRDYHETIPITISAAKQVPYCSEYNLDFTDNNDLKAYVATGYDKATGTIWLTRVKQVPANTGFLLMGEAGDYEIPVAESAADCYYKNMFKGTILGETIYTTDGKYTNYYLSNGDYGVGFYKVGSSVALKANRAYLAIPTDIPANGSEGDTEVIKVGSALQVPYYTSKNIDFSSMDAQGVKAYTATGYNYKTGTIWLSRVKKVPAHTGVLVMADAAGEYSVPTASVASVYANMFVGSESAQTIYDKETIDGVDYLNYYLSNGDYGVGFYRAKSDGVKLGINRCYLQVPNRATSGARGDSSEAVSPYCDMIISDDVIAIPVYGGMGGDNDDTTDIQSSIFNVQSDDVYYNLQGQRVDKPGKGVYIKNGRKVVIK